MDRGAPVDTPGDDTDGLHGALEEADPADAPDIAEELASELADRLDTATGEPGEERP